MSICLRYERGHSIEQKGGKLSQHINYYDSSPFFFKSIALDYKLLEHPSHTQIITTNLG